MKKYKTYLHLPTCTFLECFVVGGIWVHMGDQLFGIAINPVASIQAFKGSFRINLVPRDFSLPSQGKVPGNEVVLEFNYNYFFTNVTRLAYVFLPLI